MVQSQAGLEELIESISLTVEGVDDLSALKEEDDGMCVSVVSGFIYETRSHSQA